jgi:Type I phosphodiesterase / nucleotide pyrophosphatase
VIDLLLADQAKIGPASEAALEHLPDAYAPLASMRAVAPTVCTLLGAEPPADADEAAIGDVVETLSGSERIAHIVIDAYGMATWKCHSNIAHTFNSLANVRQVELQSVLPAITPVNFSTIASGASPDRHNVRNREETLTVDTSFARLAAAGKTTAVCGRVLSTTGILLAGHSAIPSRAESNLDKEVMELFVQRTAEGVDYILAHLLDVDEAGHEAGPFSVRSRQAIGRTDFRLATKVRAAAENGYALLLHADHGQHDVEPEDNAPEGMKGTHSGRRQEDVRVPFIYLTNTELRQALGG